MVYLRWLLFVSVSLLHLLDAAEEQVNEKESLRIRSIQGTHFDVVGADARSVSYVEGLTESIVAVGEKYLEKVPPSFRTKVFVALRPIEHVNFEGPYRLAQDQEKINLDFNWNEDLALKAACYALSEAYLKQYSIHQYGIHAPELIRAWVISAFANEAYLRLRPAAYVGMVEQARGRAIPECAPLLAMELQKVDSNQFEQGYWVLQVMKTASFNRADIAYYCERAVAGEDISAILERFLQPEDAKEVVLPLQTWWDFQYSQLLEARLERFESMDVSRDWIGALANFDAYKAEGRDLGNLRTLWEHREDEALRETLSARLELIRMRVVQVNPAYFNAARSLGALYETVLESEKQFEFIRALTFYLRDYEDTKRLHGKVLKELEAN